jgi:hypothetical protein
VGSDEEIVEASAALAPIGFRKVPVEGRWMKNRPFRERVVGEQTTAVVCEDLDILAVVVDRSSGEVLLVDPDGAIHLVNRSLP